MTGPHPLAESAGQHGQATARPAVRRTAQREAIMAVFLRHPRPLRIHEVLAYGRERVPSLDQATVYRNLNRLEAQGWLARLTHPALGTLFERTEQVHHHHFYCRRCDRIFAIFDCHLVSQPGLPRGFVADEHLIFYQGTCGECNPRDAAQHGGAEAACAPAKEEP
jgi:Fur family ferric uptake transcriptional regulator